jgi:hypothetical protein
VQHLHFLDIGGMDGAGKAETGSRNRNASEKFHT